MERPDHLAAELNGSFAVEADLLDPSSDAVARLEHGDVGAGPREIAGSVQPGEPRPEHEDVGHRSSSRATVVRISSRACARSTRPR